MSEEADGVEALCEFHDAVSRDDAVAGLESRDTAVRRRPQYRTACLRSKREWNHAGRNHRR